MFLRGAGKQPTRSSHIKGIISKLRMTNVCHQASCIPIMRLVQMQKYQNDRPFNWNLPIETYYPTFCCQIQDWIFADRTDILHSRVLESWVIIQLYIASVLLHLTING